MEPMNLRIGEKLKSIRMARTLSLDDTAALLSLADLHRPVPQDEPQRPPQDKDVFFYTIIMLVRGMAAL